MNNKLYLDDYRDSIDIEIDDNILEITDHADKTFYIIGLTELEMQYIQSNLRNLLNE